MTHTSVSYKSFNVRPALYFTDYRFENAGNQGGDIENQDGTLCIAVERHRTAVEMINSNSREKSK